MERGVEASTSRIILGLIHTVRTLLAQAFQADDDRQRTIPDRHFLNMPRSGGRQARGGMTHQERAQIRRLENKLKKCSEDLEILEDEHGHLVNSQVRQDRELRALTEQKALTEQSLQQLQEKVSDQNQEIRVLTIQKARTERRLQQLQRTVWEQGQEIKACKDELFNLQPMPQPSDVEVLGQYETLCQRISNWVDEEVSNYEEKHLEFENDVQAVMDRNGPFVKEFLSQAPEVWDLLIKALIHEHIQQNFFGHDAVYFGSSPDLTSFIEEIRCGMRNLEPQRGTNCGLLFRPVRGG